MARRRQQRPIETDHVQPMPVDDAEPILCETIIHPPLNLPPVDPSAPVGIGPVSPQLRMHEQLQAKLGKTICPHCGASGFVANKSIPVDEGQFRRRKCKQCGHFTEEIQPPAIPI